MSIRRESLGGKDIISIFTEYLGLEGLDRRGLVFYIGGTTRPAIAEEGDRHCFNMVPTVRLLTNQEYK